MNVQLRLVTEEYVCTPCLRERGVRITALVRMMPHVILLDGEPVGNEAWCCPACYRPAFPIRRPKLKAAKV